MQAASYCRNCNLFLGAHPGNYCSHCGQSTALRPPTVGEFLHEFIGHYVALEGRLARTLALLLFRPGELTRRYLAGQKERFVNPLRLYLSVSLIFFVTLKVAGMIGIADAVKVAERQESVSAGVQFNSGADQGMKIEAGSVRWRAPAVEAVQCDEQQTWCVQARDYLRVRHADKTVGQLVAHVQSRALAWAPYAAFLLTPVFAWLTGLLYWRRKLFYGEHFVYALHMHSFAFLALTLEALVPAALESWVILAGAIYFFFAMHRVFGGRRWLTFLRYAALAIAYPIFLLLALALSFLLALFP